MTWSSQSGPAQGVPASAVVRHAPAPSQVPSAPHDRGSGAASQSLRGSFPFFTRSHVPSVLPVNSCLQDVQCPSQAESQQTPSTQNPDSQPLASVHDLLVMSL